MSGTADRPGDARPAVPVTGEAAGGDGEVGGATTLAGLAQAAWPGEDAPFVHLPDGSVLTYGEADEQAARLASVMAEAGAGPGGRVALQVERSPLAIVCYLACVRNGAVLVPLNPALSAREVAAVLDDTEPAVVIADPAAPAGAWPGALHAAGDGSGSLAEAVAAARPVPARPARPQDPVVLLTTSGTTGRPKGVALTQANLGANAADLVEAWGFSRHDVLVHVLPLFHVHGLCVAVDCVLASGASLRFLPRFEPARVVAAFGQSTVMMGVPTHYHRLLAEPGLDAAATAPMRLFVSGSAPLPPRVFAGFAERTGKEVLERYGMTETGMLCSNPLEGPRRPGTVGRPLPGVEVRVVDPATGTAAPAGQVGAIEVRGANVFSGYLGLPEANAAAFTPDGFLRTGDLGSFGEDGYLRIAGRAKDLVISGGFNVYPREVEAALEELAGVAEAAVVGVADEDLGERVVAAVVRVAGSDVSVADLPAALAGRLARYKVPRMVVAVDALPRNAMGKLDKAALRRRLAGGDPPGPAAPA